MAYQKPIVHGNPTNETPEKCLRCGNRVYSEGRWICSKNVNGKFVGTLAYSCFTYPKKVQE